MHAHEAAAELLARRQARNSLISFTEYTFPTFQAGAHHRTIADALDIALQEQGRITAIIDGDSVRGGLCRDLGFTDSDRDENIRRVAEVARLMLEAGLIVIVALISPSSASRHFARSIIGNEFFVEVHVDAPLETAEKRDPKGLYKKARAGLIKNFTGIDSRYDVPVFPEVHLDTQALSVEQSVATILDWVAHNDGCT